MMLAIAFFPLAACTLPDAGVGVEGDLKLLYAPFSLDKPPRYWHYVKKPADMQSLPALAWVDKDGRIALAARPGIGAFEIGRRTNVLALASPYLSFDWQQNSSARAGDVELLLGYRQQDQGSWTESDFGSGKPTIDQVVRIPIGGDTVHRGQWQREFFDLAAVHRRYWPDTTGIEVRLVWIGIASARATGETPPPDVTGVTYLSHILLSR